jgi:hypothetical protein
VTNNAIAETAPSIAGNRIGFLPEYGNKDDKGETRRTQSADGNLSLARYNATKHP